MGDLDTHLIHASLGPIESTTQTASLISFLHSSHQSVVQHVSACPSPSKFPLPMGKSGPHLICGSLGPPYSASQTAYRLGEPFLYSSRQTVPILYNGRPFPQKIAHSDGQIWTPSNTWFLGHDQVLNSNGILIGSAIYAPFMRTNNYLTIYFHMAC